MERQNHDQTARFWRIEDGMAGHAIVKAADVIELLLLLLFIR